MSEPQYDPSKFDAEAQVKALAGALGLTIEPEWEAAVIMNLKGAAMAATPLMREPLPDECEPAAVFEPGR